MYDNETKFIVEYLSKKGYSSKEKAIEKSSIPIICAREYYGRHAKDDELIPFERATEELIELEILISTNSKFSESVHRDRYYLDLTKIQDD